jgi:hypothetical protein
MDYAMKRLLLAGVMGAALAAPITSAMAQTTTVPTDPQGFSPYDTHGTLDENINTSTIRNAPALGLSSIYGLNPCSLGASAGVSTPLFGIAGAISTTDKDCETRNTAALAITGLKDEAAGREIMCTIPQFREAVARLGKPCIGDQPPQRVALQQQPSVQPVAAQVATPAVPVAAKPTLAPNAPTFCNTAGLVLSAYPECTHPQVMAEPHAKRSTPNAVSRNVQSVHNEAPELTPPVPPVPTTIRPSVPDAAIKTPPNMVALLTQRRTVLLTAGDTTAVRLIDQRIAALDNPVNRPQTERPEQTGNVMATLMQRGAALVAANDLVAARLCYQRAVESGNSQAAIEIAKTYDPRVHTTGTNLALAEHWYRQATVMADTDAMNLARMASR